MQEDASSVSFAPTAAIDSWTVYFTALMESELSITATSYVWIIKDEEAQVTATVLIDSSGEAAGVALYNSTLVYFTDKSGAVWTIDNDGLEATEIFSYDEHDLTGTPSGMDIWPHFESIFWTDLDGSVYSASLKGDDFVTLTTVLGMAYDISIDYHKGQLYVSDLANNMIVKMATDGSLLTDYLEVLTPRGVWADSESGALYFASYNGTYIGQCELGSDDPVITVTLDNSTLSSSPISLGIDYLKQLIFYTLEDSVNVYSLETKENQIVAYLTGLQYIWVEAYVSPTPAPTPVPTSLPVPVPTSSPLPVPTTAPSSAPVPAPTTSPSSSPSKAPTFAPMPLPTAAPTSVPNSAPTPEPSTSPTSFCDYWTGQCALCECSPTPAPSGAGKMAFTHAPTTAPVAFTHAPTTALYATDDD